MDLCDNLTYVGLAFMTLGMLTGAIWAKEAWGALLGLGPERDLGGSYLVRLSGVYPFQIRQAIEGTSCVDYSVSIICPVANVLVWNQLPSIGTGSQCAYL